MSTGNFSEVLHSFRNVGMGLHYQNTELKQLLEEEGYASPDCFYVGIFFGLRTNLEQARHWDSYQQHIHTCTVIQEQIARWFQEKHLGFEIGRDYNSIQMMGVFPRDREDFFVAETILPIQEWIYREHGLTLYVGVGMPTDDLTQLKTTYETSQYAFDLYFFEESPLIEFQHIHKDFTPARDYYDLVEDAIRAILSKDPSAMDKVLAMVDLFGEIHYGNWRAVIMRTMDYSGALASRLYRYRLLDGSFFRMQDEFQETLFQETTLRGLRQRMENHFSALIHQIHHRDRLSGTAVIEKVKLYMEENYMEELAVKDLADIACVSVSYFSHMFKHYTGKNYKTYLTEIRMQKAQELLMETDFLIYEISEMVGYRMPRTFVSAFRSAYGISPMEFRKKHTKA